MKTELKAALRLQATQLRRELQKAEEEALLAIPPQPPYDPTTGRDPTLVLEVQRASSSRENLRDCIGNCDAILRRLSDV